MGLKVLSVFEFLLSHVLIAGGLVMITLGLLNSIMVLNVIGIWVTMLGFCLAFTFTARKLYAK